VLVEGSTEADDAFEASMADIHPYKHRLSIVHLGQSHMVQVSSTLRIYLLQELGS